MFGKFESVKLAPINLALRNKSQTQSRLSPIDLRVPSETHSKFPRKVVSKNREPLAEKANAMLKDEYRKTDTELVHVDFPARDLGVQRERESSGRVRRRERNQ